MTTFVATVGRLQCLRTAQRRYGLCRARATLARGMATSGGVLGKLDGEQARLMEERVILIDRDDKVIGSASKLDSHHQSKGLPLHRAFSVFLFNSDKKMLLQQRASVKATFPSYWTNACCSHPLHVENELAPGGDEELGVRNAAVRKLSHELGIGEGLIKPSEFLYLTRIHYKATSGGEWGEHEIDYVLFLEKDLSFDPSPNEVDEIRFVSPGELKEMFAAEEKGELSITPWFKYIMESSGFMWWERLGTEQLSECIDKHNITRFGGV